MALLMKGQSYKDRYKKGVLRYTFPVQVEEKRDEIRAHFRLVRCTDSGKPVSCEVVSYAGKPLYNLGKQCEWMYSVLLREGLNELDCGVEVNGSYDDTYRYVRTKKGIPEGLENAEVVVLLFDIPEMDEPYGTRIGAMLGIIKRACRQLEFHRPNGWLAYSEAEVDVIYGHVRSKGLEGVMVKTLDHKYERARSWSWFKRKPSETHDGQIEGFVQAVCGKDQPEKGLKAGQLLPRIGAVVLRLEDCSTATPHGIPHALGEDMLHNPNKYMGQWAEFTCMERDRQGGYRHPVFKRLREAKA